MYVYKNNFYYSIVKFISGQCLVFMNFRHCSPDGTRKHKLTSILA